MLKIFISIFIATVIMFGIGSASNFSFGQSMTQTEPTLKENCMNPTNMSSNYRTIVCTHTFGMFNNTQFNGTVPDIDLGCATSTGWYVNCSYLGPSGNSSQLDQIYGTSSQDGGQSFYPPLELVSTENSSSTLVQNLERGISHEKVYEKWEQTVAPDNKFDVFLKISDDAGETFGDAINISNSPDNDSIQSKLDVHEDTGKYTIAWVEVYPSGWAVKFTCGMC